MIRDEAIAYIKTYRKLDEDLQKIAPKNSVSYKATSKCLEYWDMAIKALENNKTGHWIWRSYGGIDTCKCSVCGGGSWEMEFDYCAYCGAKME